jgi:tripartite-type tricarboxylate transporter receptor subunit TctC
MMAGWKIAVIIALGALLNAGEGANAQIQSRNVIRVVVPFTAGSPNDLMARLVGDQLSSRLQQAVIIENRPGAGTTIGSKAVATAVPDGNTLLFIGSSLVIDPPLYKTTDYHPIKSFAPIAAVASTPWVMVVPSTLPVTSIRELVAHARTNPGKMNFGYALGTASQLLGELFKIATVTEIASVPYKGGTGVVPDMLGGRVQLYFGTARNDSSLDSRRQAASAGDHQREAKPPAPGGPDDDRERPA